MPKTRKSIETVEGRKRRLPIARMSIPPKAKKEGRRGSRSSLRMQNKMSGVTLPDIKDVDNLPARKERTPRKSSKEELKQTEQEKSDPVIEDVVFIAEESAVEEAPEKSGESEEETSCTDVPEIEEEKVVSVNVEKNQHEDSPSNNLEQETVSEPSPVITGENEPVHVEALA